MKLIDLENKKLDGNQVIYLMHNIKNGHYVDEPIMALRMNCRDGESLMTIANELASKGVDILGPKNYWFAVKDSNGHYIPPKVRDLSKRNILVRTNLFHDKNLTDLYEGKSVKGIVFQFYFESDRKYFMETVLAGLDCNIVHQSIEEPWELVVDFVDSPFKHWEDFCDDNNVKTLEI